MLTGKLPGLAPGCKMVWRNTHMRLRGGAAVIRWRTAKQGQETRA